MYGRNQNNWKGKKLMITTSEKLEIITAIINKAVKLHSTKGDDIFVRWEPHENTLYIKAYWGCYNPYKYTYDYAINFNHTNVKEMCKEVLYCLNRLGKLK